MSANDEKYELLRAANDDAGSAWLKGYADGYNERDVREPDTPYRLEYLRGYVQGVKARRS